MTLASIDIELSAPVNLRDLGGIATTGGVLREGFVIRTDDLSTITDEVATGLVDAGLVAIIDLRTADEVAITGRGPLASYPVAYHHLPLMASIGSSMSKDVPALDHESMGAMYLSMVETAAPQLVTALNIIAHAPGATAFHCAAGRDRTGVLAACLLLVLGATDDDIVADYALTGPNMPAIMERTRIPLSAVMARLGFDFDSMVGSGLSEGSMDVSMRILLAGLRSRWSDALEPLRAAGLSDDTMARLRERAVVV